MGGQRYLVVLLLWRRPPADAFAATVLEANGVPARVSADTAGGAIPSMAVLFPVRLFVRAADAELARELLDTPVDPPVEE